LEAVKDASTGSINRKLKEEEMMSEKKKMWSKPELIVLSNIRVFDLLEARR
jgi:hypothetical protein